MKKVVDKDIPATFNRKLHRKKQRQLKKSNKNFAQEKFISSKNKNGKQASNKDGDTNSKKIQKLKEYVANAKAEMKKESSDKPGVNKLNNNKAGQSAKKSGGPVFSSNIASRMNALQQYVNTETKQTNGDQNTQSKKKKKIPKPEDKQKKKTKPSIKDKIKLEELEKGMENDNKEINDIYRQLHFNSHQKKSSTNMLRNVFGQDVGEIFDGLETLPTEAQLLSQERLPLSQPQKVIPNRKRARSALELPANTIRVSTKFGSFEQDQVKPQTVIDTTKVNEENGKQKKCKLLKRKLPPTDDGLIVRKKRNIPVVYEFEGLEDEMPLSRKQQTVAVVQDSLPPTRLKPILSSSKKKKKVRSVTFNTDKNHVRLIPVVSTVNGFTVVEGDPDIFFDINPDNNYLLNEIFGVSIPSEDGQCQLREINGDEEDNSDASDDEAEYDSDDFGMEYAMGSDDSETDDIDLEAEFTDSENEEDIDMEAEFSDSESDDIHMEAKFSSDSDSENDSDTEAKKLTNGSQKETYKEDIYGRLRDSDGRVVDEQQQEDDKESGGGGGVAYSSPATRLSDSQLQEQLSGAEMKRVRTQLRGRLNRLAEVNLPGTVTMVEGLYRSHPRHLLNVVLSELLLAELAGASLTLDRHCQECAMLLAATASSVADEVGAHILTDFILSWHKERYTTSSNTHRLTNYTMFVSHLYGFGVVHCALIYDILAVVAKDFTPAGVDQMIQIVGSVGFLLRKDDPEALKEVIMTVQRKCGEKDAPPQSEHLQTMLRAVKNNNESKMPGYDPSYTDKLRKLLQTVTGGAEFSPLRVTLEDLLLSETRGRWWVVGSAWTGASLDRPTLKQGKNTASSSSPHETQFSASFLKLAESMRITRPPKINILFALTVGSEDNLEAFSKLVQLSLPPSQEKIIFDVMLYCIQKMRQYKNFYSLLANQMCNHDPKYKRLLQFALWDKFSDFDALKVKELKNLAKFIVEIVKADSLNLSLLKTLPFADANKKIVGFLQDIFNQLFDAKEGCHVSRDAFEKLYKSKKLCALRIQLKIFLNVFIVPKLEQGELQPTSALFGKRLKTVLDMLSADQGVLL